MEAMVSAGLAAVVLLGLAASTISVARANTVSRNAAAATALAQQQLEALRSLPIGAAGLGAGTYEDATNPLTADGVNGGIYQRTWVISAADTPSLGLKTVTVSVAWTDYNSHQSSLSAYIRCSTVPCP